MSRSLMVSNSEIFLLTFHIKHNNVEKVKQILHKNHLDEKQGHCLLYCAVLCQRFEIVQELLKKGCKVTFAGDSDPFRNAILSGNIKIVQLLLVHGADLLSFVPKNRDIFHAGGNKLCRMIHFVTQGRTVDVKESLQQLELCPVVRYEIIRLAVSCGYINMVKELLSLNFELSMKSFNLKQTPLEIALSRHNYEMAELIEMEKSYLF